MEYLVKEGSIIGTHDEKSADISLLQPYITCYMWKRVSQEYINIIKRKNIWKRTA